MEPPEATSKMHLACKFPRNWWTISLYPWTTPTPLKKWAKTNLRSTQWWAVDQTTIRADNFTFSLTPLTDSTKSEIWVRAMELLPSCRGLLSFETVSWLTSGSHTLWLIWSTTKMTTKIHKITATEVETSPTSSSWRSSLPITSKTLTSCKYHFLFWQGFFRVCQNEQ